MSCDHLVNNEGIARQPVNFAVTVSTATVTPITIPQNSTEILIVCQDDTVDFEVSFEGAMASPFPVAAGETFVIGGPIQATTIYLLQSSGGPVDFTYGYLIVPT